MKTSCNSNLHELLHHIRRRNAGIVGSVLGEFERLFMLLDDGRHTMEVTVRRSSLLPPPHPALPLLTGHGLLGLLAVDLDDDVGW